VRQVASVVKDGHVRYYLADIEEGELVEFATIAVPDNWGAEASIKLGFNLIGALGLNGHKPHKPVIDARQPALPAAKAPSRTWKGTPSAIEYIKAHPGCRIPEIVRHFRTSNKAVASAVTRGAATGDIIRRGGDLFPAGNGSSIMDTMAPRPSVSIRLNSSLIDASAP